MRFRARLDQPCPDLVPPPRPRAPSTQLVEKKVMFRVSKGLSCVQSGERVWGSDSPVREELSTWGWVRSREGLARGLGSGAICPQETGGGGDGGLDSWV